jgi:hypothetical protein
MGSTPHRTTAREFGMKSKTHKNSGTRALIRRYRQAFRIAENIDYYSAEDYKNAERQFIKFAVQSGGVPLADVHQNNSPSDR